jgi:hypothetical protein
LRQLVLPGVALAVATLAAGILLAVLDTTRSEKYRSPLALLSPDPVAASTSIVLAGTAEGVAIALVIVVVVLGVQLTADRYSPRIIDIFVRDPLNSTVLGLFLFSIIFSVWVSVQIKPDYVPALGYAVAIGLAVIDFVVLLPYVRHMFHVMRAETLIMSIRRRGTRSLAKAARANPGRGPRYAFRESLEQITDIALGSIQEGDTEVCLGAIEELRELLVNDYLPVKQTLPKHWFHVRTEDMPGASEQAVKLVEETRTWVEYSVLSDLLDLIGETPAFRKEVIHAISRATRNIGVVGIRNHDSDLEEMVIRFFNTYLRAAMNQKAPTFAYSIMNEYRRLALDCIEDRPELTQHVAEHLLRYGRSFEAAGMPFIIGTAVEDVATLTREQTARDEGRALALAQLLAHTLREMAARAHPLAVNGVVTALIKLSLWAIHHGHEDIADELLRAIGSIPGETTATVLQRMERARQGVFYEVSDRVVAFDWVEEELRARIPGLRDRLAAHRATVEEAVSQVMGEPATPR